MSQYKPYPAYKDSGVEWLGWVPEHWDVGRLRHNTDGALSYGANEAAESDDPRHPRFIRITDLNENGTLRDDTFKSLSLDIARPYLLKDGDVLLARSGATVGKSFIYRGDMGEACYAGYLIRVRLLKSKFLPKLFWYCTQSSYYWDFIAGSNIQATIQNVSGEKYSNLWIAIPPTAEQRSIIASLDRETARIDALVAKKTRFIELLREKRQALITHAVTKGLDPNVKMKDSGVEWLGEVPEHWELMPLKYVTPSLTVGVVVNPSDYVAEEGLPFLYGGDIGEGEIYAETARRISPEDSERNAKTRLMRGDLVTVRVGAPGVTAVVPPECEGGNCASVMLIRRGHFESDWLCYVMNSRVVRYQVEVVQYGAAQEQFNISHAVDFLIPVPPREEQAAIASALNQERQRVDALLRKTERSIALLKERRSALITAAVTGQIDLREAV